MTIHATSWSAGPTPRVPSGNLGSTVPPQSPTVRTVFRAGRGPVLTALLVGLVALLAAAVSATRTSQVLDPDTYGDAGGHAVAALLAQRGVQVLRVTDPTRLVELASSHSTVFIPHPGLEPELATVDLARLPGELVVADPGPDILLRLDAGLEPVGDVGTTIRQPRCSLDVAVRAGDAFTGGLAYRAAGRRAASGCYPAAGGATVVRLPGRRLTVLGSAAFLTNQKIGDRGDAALALGVLAQGDTVIWLVPDLSPTDASSRGHRPLNSFVPDGVKRAILGLALAVVVLALSRARRLGRVVAEPLPVVVRAAEAVEGRGRLYRAARARDSAAAALQTGCRERLCKRLGLSLSSSPDAVIAVVSAQAGRDPAAIHGLLYGAAPVDDAALVRLADDLDTLTREVSGT